MNLTPQNTFKFFPSSSFLVLRLYFYRNRHPIYWKARYFKIKKDKEINKTSLNFILRIKHTFPEDVKPCATASSCFNMYIFAFSSTVLNCFTIHILNF